MSNRTRLRVAGLEGLARARATALPSAAPATSSSVDLGVVDRDDQAVAVLGALGLAVDRRPGRPGPGPWPCAGCQPVAGAVGQQPVDGLGRARAPAAGPGRRPGAASAVVSAGAAVPRATGSCRPSSAGAAGRARPARSSPAGRGRRGPRRPARPGRGWRTSGPGRPGPRRRGPGGRRFRLLACSKLGLAAGAQGVQERGAGLVVAAARPWRTPA